MFKNKHIQNVINMITFKNKTNPLLTVMLYLIMIVVPFVFFNLVVAETGLLGAVVLSIFLSFVFTSVTVILIAMYFQAKEEVETIKKKYKDSEEERISYERQKMAREIRKGNIKEDAVDKVLTHVTLSELSGVGNIENEMEFIKERGDRPYDEVDNTPSEEPKEFDGGFGGGQFSGGGTSESWDDPTPTKTPTPSYSDPSYTSGSSSYSSSSYSSSDSSSYGDSGSSDCGSSSCD